MLVALPSFIGQLLVSLSHIGLCPVRPDRPRTRPLQSRHRATKHLLRVERNVLAPRRGRFARRFSGRVRGTGGIEIPRSAFAYLLARTSALKALPK